MSVLERFLRYVQIDTMSAEDAKDVPSTAKQFDLANVLVKELHELGLKDIIVDKHCIVSATLPKNTTKDDYTIGFLAHMDTIPDFSGTNVRPNVVTNYQGDDILLKEGRVLSKRDFPVLEKFIGKTLITTDGTTVLGADDKAGIANIFGMLEYFYNNPSVEHTEIKVAFTPDEEVGGGIDKFNVASFGADFAYTIDGGSYDIVNYECFNAASAKVYIKGLNIHPGSAYKKMINASVIATEFEQMLPPHDKPMYTKDYEGFNHLCSIKGDVGYAELDYILRNHDEEKLNEQKQLFIDVANKLNDKYGEGTVSVTITDSYKNMASLIKRDSLVLNRYFERTHDLGISAKTEPIRGGTDGARLTFLGLPCPNIGTGGYNCHGPYEFACLEEMEEVVKILIEIAKTK